MSKHYKLLFSVFTLLFYNSIIAQNVSVSGSVTSKSDNKPLPDVTVTVNGTGKGTKTGNDGKFSLTAATNSVVTFSFVGYQSQQVTLQDGVTQLNISLEN